MSSVNKVILVGNVGRDPETRTTQSGGKVVSFSLATSETWRDKATGDRKEKTTWHNIVIWNENIGKVVEQYVKKGTKVYLEGAIEVREWTDKDGAKRTSTEVVLQRYRGELVLLSEKSRDTSAPRDYGPRMDSPTRALAEDIDDDIPFGWVVAVPFLLPLIAGLVGYVG